MALAKHNVEAKTCDVAGCSNEAERSLNKKLVEGSSLQFSSPDLRSVHLCKQHYRDIKKETKTNRELNSLY